MRKLLGLRKKTHKDKESGSGGPVTTPQGPPQDGGQSLVDGSPQKHPDEPSKLEEVPRSTFTGNIINAGNDVNVNIVTQNFETKEDELVQLRAMLNPVDTAAYDSYASAASQRSVCFEGTRVQLLEEIQNWVTGHGSEAAIFVLDGVAGIGKSTVAQTVAQRAADDGILGASFFFSRDEEMRKTARHFFPTLAFHLARHDKEFALQSIKILKRHPDAGQKALVQQFTTLVSEPLQKSSSLTKPDSQILIVIDALDECDEDEARIVLTLLAQSIHSLPQLRIFITSRPEWHIRDVLDREKNHDRFHLHEIEESIVQSDIRLYLDFSLSITQVERLLPGIQPPWQPAYEDRITLYGICGTLFILAATATKFILDSKRSDPEKQLSRLLEGVSLTNFSGSKRTDIMDKFYIQILRSAVPEDLDEDDDWFENYRAFLGAIIILQNPLPCQALARLLEVKPLQIEGTLRHLHSLVAPSDHDRIFRVHHKSFPDFITDEGRIKKSLNNPNPSSRDSADNYQSFRIDEAAHHLTMAKQCFRIMRQNLKRNMNGLTLATWYKDTAELQHHQDLRFPQEFAYACTHWASHLAGSLLDIEVLGDIQDWTAHYILAWLEFLCIVEKVDVAHESLEKAHKRILDSMTLQEDYRSSTNQEILELLDDAARFVQQNGRTLRLSPMHIYWSGLPFVPPKTRMHSLYPSPGSLKVLSGIEENWDPAIATLTGHRNSVNWVTYSPDSSKLASASQDGLVKLWDGKTGVPITTLKGHSGSVYTVEFSSNGIRLVSSSWDKTVRLWDGRTGACIATLDAHSAIVFCAAFSGDGYRIASGSKDCTVRLWDGKTGVHITTLGQHNSDIAFVAFSKTNKPSRLASASLDKTVGLWDGTTGNHIATLTGHSHRVKFVAFSMDGLRLASASQDNSLRLWDGITGSHIATMNGHSNWVTSLAFSNDGAILSSGSSDKTLKLWNGKTGAHISTLAGHTAAVSSVVFSNDGGRLVSGSFDKTVRIWDTNSGTLIRTLKGHSGTVYSVAFASDGSRIASACWDKTVRLWDGRTTVHDTIPNWHSKDVTCIAFASDGSKFASGSSDMTIRLWHGKTGVLLSTLEGHSHQLVSIAFPSEPSKLISASQDGTIISWDVNKGVWLASFTGHASWANTVAFSHDGLRIASASQTDRGILLLDGVTGAVTATLEGHQHRINHLKFSYDGSRLASASQDKTVRLWDGITGAPIATFEGHTGHVNCVGFSADGRMLASGSWDSALRLWDSSTGSAFTTLVNNSFWIHSIGFFDTSSESKKSSHGAIIPHPPALATKEMPSSSPDSVHLFLLVRRKETNISGLVMLKSLEVSTHLDITPFCWFPPDFEVTTISMNNDRTLIAVGCTNGRVILLDISSISLP